MLKDKGIIYPTVEDIININRRIIDYRKITKAERHHFLRSPEILEKILDEVKRVKGDIRTKAAILLCRINQAHIFESANKRTSLIIAHEFMIKNGVTPRKKKINDGIFLTDIREGKTIEEIARWL